MRHDEVIVSHAAGPELEVDPRRPPARGRALHRRVGPARRRARPGRAPGDIAGAGAREGGARPAERAGLGRRGDPVGQLRAHDGSRRPAGSRPPAARRARRRGPRSRAGRCRRPRRRRRCRRRGRRSRRGRWHCRTETSADVASAYLATFVSASQIDEVGGGLERGRQALRRARAVTVTGTGARAASPASAGSSPRSVSTAGWMPRASSRSSGSAVLELLDRRATRSRSSGCRPSGHPQRQRERDEVLLRAVVQVALDPPARVVAGRDQPRARRAQLLVAGPQLGVEALVAQREPGRRARGAHQLRLLEQRGVVHDRGAHRLLDLGHGASTRATRRGAPRRRRSGRGAAASRRA